MSVRDRLVGNQVGVYAVAVLVAVALGVGRPGLDSGFEALIEPVLVVLLYVTFLEVRSFDSARRSPTVGSWVPLWG